MGRVHGRRAAQVRRRRRARPLLVVLDCKGGASSRKVADRTRRVLRDAGARSTAVWPDEASLSLWTLPPDHLVTTLLDLIEHGTGGAAYYTDVMEALVALAVYAPCGPPTSSADFLTRLDADWLAAAYAASGDGDGSRPSVLENGLRRRAAAVPRAVAAARRGARRRLVVRGLRRLVLRLEGTAEAAVAEAQAQRADRPARLLRAARQREILLSSMSSPRSQAAAHLAAVRTGQVARPRRPGVGAVLGGARRGRGRAAAGRRDRGGRDLAAAHAPARASGGTAGTMPSVDTSRRFERRARGAMTDCRGPSARRCSTGIWCGASTWGRPATCTAAERVPAGQAANGRQAEIGSGIGVRSPAAAAPPARQTAAAPDDPPTAPLPVPGPALPDAGELLDEAFGERRG